MDAITIVGLVAAAFTTISLFPQVLNSWRTRGKPSKDNTLVKFSTLFCIGIFLWLLYGLWKMDLPMSVANSLSLLQGVVILVIQVQRLRKKTMSLLNESGDY